MARAVYKYDDDAGKFDFLGVSGMDISLNAVVDAEYVHGGNEVDTLTSGQKYAVRDPEEDSIELVTLSGLRRWATASA